MTLWGMVVVMDVGSCGADIGARSSVGRVCGIGVMTAVVVVLAKPRRFS